MTLSRSESCMMSDGFEVNLPLNSPVSHEIASR